MAHNSQRITRAEAKNALLRSGYLLESRIDNILRDKGYYVDANSAYQDCYTEKAREIDIYALAAHKTGLDEYDYIFHALVVECVNNPQPIALITKEPLVPFLHREQIKLAGIPAKIPSHKNNTVWESLPDFLHMDKYHHYCRGRIATQFCSFQKKGNQPEWMAFHDEIHFNAFTKLCDAIEFFISKHYKSWHFSPKEKINIQFYYPVLVVQGELLDVRPSPRGVRITGARRILFRQASVTNSQATEYFIDVMTEKEFPKYLETIDEEMKATADLINKNNPRIREATELISQAAKELRSPDEIKRALEFTSRWE